MVNTYRNAKISSVDVKSRAKSNIALLGNNLHYLNIHSVRWGQGGDGKTVDESNQKKKHSPSEYAMSKEKRILIIDAAEHKEILLLFFTILS